jgi:hypothetical protein
MSEGSQEVDEFAGIEAPPARRHPLLALAVLALGGVLLWHLRADVSYAFTSGTPDDLGDARSLGPAALSDNRYVTLRGQPDRRNSLFIEPKGEKTRQTFFRLLGTDTRVLVRAADSAGRSRLENRWSGRLRRLSALSWAPSLQRYYSEEVSAARYLPLAALRDGTHAGTLRDRSGESLQLTPATPVHVDSLYPNELLVTLSAEKFPNAADAQHELEKLGIQVLSPRKNPAGDFDFVVAAPAAGRAAVIDKLDKAEIGFAAHQERQTVPFSELRSPAPEVTAVSVDAPIHVPDDAWVLTEDEAPGGVWWAPVVAALLLAFMAFNVWYLVRTRRA